jgi:hypothetical protein
MERRATINEVLRTRHMSRILVSERAFKGMLTRRGYDMDAIRQQGSLWYIIAPRNAQDGAARQLWMDSGALAHRSLLEAEQLIDSWLGGGQHHMQHSCGAPLLREVASSYHSADLTVQTTNWYEYHSVAAGPLSPDCERCLLCGAPMDDGSVREFEDDDDSTVSR